MANDNFIIQTKNFSFFYGDQKVLEDININVKKESVTAVIGPSGCGKSTFLRSLNRMNDLIDNVRIEGHVLLDDKDIYSLDTDLINLRKKVGMVFQRPNPFPKSIFDNVAFGPRIHGQKNKKILNDIVEDSLVKAGLWKEVKNKLDKSAFNLSGGQQQRLCIARTLAIEPEVILMDEPASALDPASTQHIEDLIYKLKQNYTIIIVTHNMQQAARISDYTAFVYEGHIIEFGPTKEIFTRPEKKQTEDYITGRFG